MASSSNEVVASTLVDNESQVSQLHEMLDGGISQHDSQFIRDVFGTEPLVVEDDEFNPAPENPPVSLPIAKRQRTNPPETPSCRDRIKWVDNIPFVQSAATGTVHSGRCTMNKVSHPGGYASVICGQNCCIFSGQAHGGLCDCLCHVFATSYRR